ncbi:hypothetical protein E2C01_030443 [Portunus trituberculatus]|uniref:Uncharacterized protein n=1 Tax=Portunus trituberculatus TaxID=210409 RepID=A0A5B7EQV1_PORTR|nr:hypothetical protein [Portunus trituberculatus]
MREKRQQSNISVDSKSKQANKNTGLAGVQEAKILDGAALGACHWLLIMIGCSVITAALLSVWGTRTKVTQRNPEVRRAWQS